MTKLILDENWVDVAGIRTRYLIGGDGDPIVFVHGGYAGDETGFESADVWHPNLAVLKDRYRCIAVDRLGQGFTDNPSAESGYAMQASVTHFIAFLQKLGGVPYHLVGHASGGYVVAQATLQNPELVRSCTIVSSDAAAPRPGRRDFLLAGNPHPPLSREGALHVLESHCFGKDSIDDEWIQQRWALMDSTKHQTAARKMHDDGLYEARYLPDLRTDREMMFGLLGQRSIGRPTMLYWGFNDPVAPLDLGYDLYELLSKHELRCQMHIVNGAGHYSFRERPQEFNRIFSDFIEDVRHGA